MKCGKSMSRIGQKLILIPNEVTVKVNQNEVEIAGPKGSLKQEIRPEIKVVVNDGKIECQRRADDKLSRSLHGTIHSLIVNMIQGVKKGFSKTLELAGTGYRVKKEGSKIILSVGFSHPVEFKSPEGVQFEVEDNNIIKVSGIDKALVGQTAAEIRAIRPPEPYKGKGIRYQGEEVKTKPGKAGKVGTTGFGGGE